MRVQEIWRFPVKSLQGERLHTVEVEPQGLRGDRAFALFDAESGLGLTARRVPQLLFAAAAYHEDGTVTITLPDGTTAADDRALSDWLSRPVTLRTATDAGERVYENPVDFESDTDWKPFSGATGAFHDSGLANVSVLSEATMGGWPRRRFRANVLVDGDGEDALVGSRLSVGTAVVEVRARIKRCVMVTRPQPDGVGGLIEKDLDVLRTIHREHGGRLAIGATIVSGGRFAVGDEVRALER